MSKKRNILVGSRIKLLALEKEHLLDRVNFINDEVVQSTLNFDYPTSLAKTEAWFNKILLNRDRVDFTIKCVATDKNIGFGGFVGFDRVVKKAELYIFIGDREYWGGGYGRDGYKLITNYGFLELGLNKVYGYQLLHNDKASMAVDKLGWSVDGVLRDDLFSHGVLKSRSVVSILKREWEKLSIYDEV